MFFTSFDSFPLFYVFLLETKLKRLKISFIIVPTLSPLKELSFTTTVFRTKSDYQTGLNGTVLVKPPHLLCLEPVLEIVSWSQTGQTAWISCGLGDCTGYGGAEYLTSISPPSLDLGPKHRESMLPYIVLQIKNLIVFVNFSDNL